MDVAGASSSSTVVLSGNNASAEGIQVSLHPLPLLNISEHYTRVRIQNRRDDVKVVGALIGVQQGREIEVMNSFELALSDDGTEINHAFFTDRQSQFKQVFPAFEFLGWYTVGREPTPIDLSIHTQLLVYNESPIFLILNSNSITQSSSSSSSGGSTLPIDIYESVVDIVGGKSVNKFTRIAGANEGGGYKIETGEAERIAVESASRQAVASTSSIAGGGGGSKPGQESSESVLVAGLTTHRNAIQMLQSRIGVILEYLYGVQKGSIAPDHETLRQIASLAASITSQPAGAAAGEGLEDAFAAEFDREQNDVLLTSLLGQMTRNLDKTNDLIDRFSVSQQGNNDDIAGMLGPGSFASAPHGRRGGTSGGGGSRGAGGRSAYTGVGGRRTADSLSALFGQ